MNVARARLATLHSVHAPSNDMWNDVATKNDEKLKKKFAFNVYDNWKKSRNSLLISLLPFHPCVLQSGTINLRQWQKERANEISSVESKDDRESVELSWKKHH